MNAELCRFFKNMKLYMGRRAKQKGGIPMELSPFQKALVKATLERYMEKMGRQSCENEADAEQRSVWIDWKTRRISMTEKDGFSKNSFSTAEARSEALKRLEKEKFVIIR